MVCTDADGREKYTQDARKWREEPCLAGSGSGEPPQVPFAALDSKRRCPEGAVPWRTAAAAS